MRRQGRRLYFSLRQWLILSILGFGIIATLGFLALITQSKVVAEHSGPTTNTPIATNTRRPTHTPNPDAIRATALALTINAIQYGPQIAPGVNYPPGQIISYRSTSRTNPAPIGFLVQYGTLTIQIIATHEAIYVAQNTGAQQKVVVIKLAFSCLEPISKTCYVWGLNLIYLTGTAKDLYPMMSPREDDNGIALGVNISGGSTLTGTVAFPLDEPMADLVLVIGNRKPFGYLALQ